MFAGASLDENSGAFCELKANFFRLILTKAELFALTEKDIDFKRKTISVSKTLTYQPEEDGKQKEFRTVHRKQMPAFGKYLLMRQLKRRF